MKSILLETQSDKRKLSFYETVLATLTIFLSGLVAFRWGWQVFSTITDRPGFWGTIHFHYDLTAFQFTLMNLMIVITSLAVIIFQFKYLLDRNSLGLKRSFWSFGLLVAFILLIQIYLNSIYIPKG